MGHRHPMSIWPRFLVAFVVAGFGAWLGSGGGEMLSGTLGSFWANSPIDSLTRGWGSFLAGSFGPSSGRILMVAGLLMFGWAALVCATTRYVVTTRRVLTCRGVVSQRVSEMTGNTIRSVSLRRNFLGSVSGYGTVWVHGFAADWVILPGTTSPLAFLRAIEAMQL